MSYVGKWVFHSVMSLDENDERVFLTAEEYLASPMPYVDESDPEAVADEIKERKSLIGTVIKVCEDGKLYMLMPLPEGVSEEEVDAAVAAGAINLVDGMICDHPMVWEERGGELWYDTGIEGEVFGEASETWAKAIDDDGFFTFMNFRFTKAD